MGARAERAARNAARNAGDVAPWIVNLARVGYGAKAVLYATIGVLALRAALGSGGQTTDTRGAMAAVVDAPFGRVLLVVIAVGLAGYAAWRFVAAIADPEQRGHDAKGLAIRTGYVARAIIHVGLAVSALRLAQGHSADSGSGGGGADDMAAHAFRIGGGSWLVWLAAIGIGAYGIYQLYRAYAAKLSEQLDVGRMSAEAGHWVIGVSRFGIAARGVVGATIAVLLARAASRHAPGEAGGIAEALDEIARHGQWPLVAVAIGLVAYGVYELLNARYRDVRVG
jgi:hypothetical protein